MTHGLHALDRRLKAGLLNPTSPLGATVRERRDAIVADLGGEDAISEQQRLLVDAVVRSSLLLDTVDQYILGMTSPINRQKRVLHGVVMQRMQIADSMARSLERLGLERRARQVDVGSTLAAMHGEQKP